MNLTDYTSAELEIAQLRRALQHGREHIERMQRRRTTKLPDADT